MARFPMPSRSIWGMESLFRRPSSSSSAFMNWAITSWRGVGACGCPSPILSRCPSAWGLWEPSSASVPPYSIVGCSSTSGRPGPLAGFAVAIPALMIGIRLSRVLPLTDLSGGIILGEPLLFSFLTEWVLGISADDYTIVLHPIALGGWLGLFVTALNLLPMGQLDGGHIIYALLGRRHRLITLGTVATLLFLTSLWIGWVIWCVFPFIVGFGHPPALDDTLPLDRSRKLVGLLCIVVFALSFTPAPFRFL